MFSQYNKNTGQIISLIKAPLEERAFYENTELGTIETDKSGDTYYVLNNEVIERPLNSITLNKTELLANGTDEIIFSSVPPNSKIIIQSFDETYEYIGIINDATESFSTTVPGEYSVLIQCFPYSYYRTEINAN